MMSIVLHTYAQDSITTLDSPAASIDSIINIIESREHNLVEVKKSNRADSLTVLVEDYALLSNLWQIEYEKVHGIALKFGNIEPLLSESDSVFINVLPDIQQVPISLMEHYKLITQIKEVQNRINEIEQVISKKMDACTQLNVDPVTVIPSLISADLESIYSQILQIKNSGLTSFSTVQQEYFEKNIIDRYNNFEKYFTNE